MTQAITRHLRPGQRVSLESTTYPCTTDDVLRPTLEQSGLEVERDFFLSHSPERVTPGNARYTTKNTNKLVGGVGPNSLDVALSFYAQTIAHGVPESSAQAVEMVKVFEHTFRAVKIGLVTEMMLVCDRMGPNVWEVLDAAFTKPFGIMPFYPGPGAGGHCIPLDPHYLEWKAREYNFNTHFIALAGEINRKMPEFVREKALRCLNRLGVASSRASILVMGVAYKRDLGAYRESPAIEVIRLLQQEGASVGYHDAFVPSFDETGGTIVMSLLTNGHVLVGSTNDNGATLQVGGAAAPATVSCPGGGTASERFGLGGDNGTATYATAVGNIARAVANNSTALGYNAQATGTQSVAAGASATASQLDAMALGMNSYAGYNKSIALGFAAKTTEANQLVVGAAVDQVRLVKYGGQCAGVRVASVSPVSVATTDYIVATNLTTAGAVTVNLPAGPAAGMLLVIKDYKGDANTNNITVNAGTGDVIDGSSSKTITVSHGSLDLAYISAQPWQASSAYSVGQQALNDTNHLYEVTTGGTSASSGGPTGTGASITDGTATWKYTGDRGWVSM